MSLKQECQSFLLHLIKPFRNMFLLVLNSCLKKKRQNVKHFPKYVFERNDRSRFSKTLKLPDFD